MARCKSMMCVATVLVVASVTMAAEPNGSVSGLFDLQSATAVVSPALLAVQDDGGAGASSGGGTLDGPYFLRSADALPVGEMELKFIYGYSSDSDHEGAIEFEWGLAENIEFILEAETALGDGKAEGNGDITELGLHTRFWGQDGAKPAFAMRNLVRIPTGYHSSGVDYTAIGLFTWALDESAYRVHFNPFITFVNGDNGDDDDGDYDWGAAIGVDHQCSDDLKIILDYKYTYSDGDDDDDSHIIELGGEWSVGPEQKIGLGTTFDLDGSNDNADFTASISYIIELG